MLGCSFVFMVRFCFIAALTLVKHTFGEEAIFVPVVLESFGYCSDEGVKKFIELLAETAARLALCSFEEFRSHAFFMLSTFVYQPSSLHPLHREINTRDHEKGCEKD